MGKALFLEALSYPAPHHHEIAVLHHTRDQVCGTRDPIAEMNTLTSTASSSLTSSYMSVLEYTYLAASLRLELALHQLLLSRAQHTETTGCKVHVGRLLTGLSADCQAR